MQHRTTRLSYWLAAAVLTVGVSSTGLDQAAAAASRAELSNTQVHRIVHLTGYHALRSHRFERAGAFTARAADVQVIKLDGARLGVPLSELRDDVDLGQQLAATGGTFTTKLKLGRGPKQSITYVVASGMSSAGRSNTRYVIFTPRSEHLGELTRPQRVPSVQALTVISRDARLAVTLLHDRSQGARWGETGLPSAPLCAMVESLNATSRVTVSPQTLHRLKSHNVDLSYLTDPNHPNPSRPQELRNLADRGFEIWSNSMGFAVMSARAGASYHHYVHRAGLMRFGFYAKNDMHYMRVSAAQYRSFG